MNMEQKIAWNQDRAEKEGWNSWLFGLPSINEEFVIEVTKFQKAEGLTADGLCGSSTYRAAYSAKMQEDRELQYELGGEYIISKGQKIKIFWDKVVTYDEAPQFKALKGFYASRSKRFPNFFVTHWDATLSSSHCFKILKDRGLAVHFMIDNDGTIIQTCDMDHVAYHAGGRLWNANSIGVEVSNAYYLKWQNWYIKKGHGARPIVKGAKVHGEVLEDHLGFYEVQERALAALWEAVSYAYGIPLRLPTNEYGVDQACVSGDFRGFIHHYNLKATKIDSAGMDHHKVLKWAMELRAKR